MPVKLLGLMLKELSMSPLPRRLLMDLIKRKTSKLPFMTSVEEHLIFRFWKLGRIWLKSNQQMEILTWEAEILTKKLSDGLLMSLKKIPV